MVDDGLKRSCWSWLSVYVQMESSVSVFAVSFWQSLWNVYPTMAFLNFRTVLVTFYMWQQHIKRLWTSQMDFKPYTTCRFGQICTAFTIAVNNNCTAVDKAGNVTFYSINSCSHYSNERFGLMFRKFVNRKCVVGFVKASKIVMVSTSPALIFSLWVKMSVVSLSMIAIESMYYRCLSLAMLHFH